MLFSSTRGRPILVKKIITPLCSTFITRSKIKKLKTLMRACRDIELNGDPTLPYRLVSEMSDSPILRDGDVANKLFNDISETDLDLRLRHNILVRIMKVGAFPKILLSNYDNKRTISFYLPKTWRDFFNNLHLQVSWKSEFRWILLQIRCLGASFIKTFRLTTFSLKHNNIKPESNYWIVENVPKGALAKLPSDKTSVTFISFLADLLKKQGAIGPAWVTKINQVETQNGSNHQLATLPFPSLGSYKKTLIFFSFGLKISVRALIGWIFGSSAIAILSSDAVEAKYIEILDLDRLPTWYLMTNSQIGARAPWTFVAERRDVKIGMVFYSTNNKPLQFSNQPPFSVYPGYQLLNWPRYFVWDKYHADWVRSVVVGDPEIIETGYIPVLDRYEDSQEFSKQTVAVFDMSIQRPSLYAELGITRIYYSDEIVRTFLFEIQKVLEKFEKIMVVKPKRYNTTNSKIYNSTLKKLAQKKNVVLLEPTAGVKNIINNSAATISIPFTSTGVVADLHGKPSAFFDPINVLEQNENTSHGIPLLQSKQALEEWVAKL